MVTVSAHNKDKVLGKIDKKIDQLETKKDSIEDQIDVLSNKFNKLALKARKRKFDLKFLLTGNSGSGKTHFTATYLSGPIHYYMFDKGGEKTVEKIAADRDDITIDNFSSNDTLFSDFWRQFQEDAASGFFDYLAENNGMLVLDSLTNANLKAISEICKKCSITPTGIGKKLDMKMGMAPPHWGQLLNWMTTLVTWLQELPCAVAVTVHLHTLMNSKQEVVARYPSVNGQFRQLVSTDFDEAYLMTTKGSKRKIFFTEKLSFEAKSRSFDMPYAEGITMEQLAQAYLKNQTVIK